MDIKELLPIGSVVLLKGGEKKVMITGVMQTNEDGKEYDYLSVIYPEGNIGKEGNFLFYHSDIEEVFFRGFQDEEREAFIERLDSFYKNR